MSAQVDDTAVQAVCRALHECTGSERPAPPEGLEAVRRIRDAADQLLGELVSEARARGVTWSDIGSRLGVTTQAAHQRYRHRVH